LLKSFFKDYFSVQFYKSLPLAIKPFIVCPVLYASVKQIVYRIITLEGIILKAMEEKEEQFGAENWLKDLPLQTEEIGFRPEEMVFCARCKRQNPPTRLKCLYCGAELEISAEQAKKVKPNLRKLENWEKGFNLIFQPSAAALDEEAAGEMAKTLGLEKDVVRKIIEARTPLPAARVETEKEAQILRERLYELGFETLVLSDETLTAEKSPRRLRGLEFQDGRLLLILFNNDEIAEISFARLGLIVSGAIFQKAVETTERRKKGENKILEASETASDELLIDIYDKTEPGGYRIPASGFDFSCLKAEKTFLARENIQKLIAKLGEFAPDAKLVNDYLRVREILGNVWEIEQRKDSQGLKRQSFKNFELSNIASSNNLQQFTKYSRLQWHLL
jgi:hypothetical protein